MLCLKVEKRRYDLVKTANLRTPLALKRGRILTFFSRHKTASGKCTGINLPEIKRRRYRGRYFSLLASCSLRLIYFLSRLARVIRYPTSFHCSRSYCISVDSTSTTPCNPLPFFLLNVYFCCRLPPHCREFSIIFSSFLPVDTLSLNALFIFSLLFFSMLFVPIYWLLLKIRRIFLPQIDGDRYRAIDIVNEMQAHV